MSLFIENPDLIILLWEKLINHIFMYVLVIPQVSTVSFYSFNWKLSQMLKCTKFQKYQFL